MAKTLKHGDVVFARKFGLCGYSRNDIIVAKAGGFNIIKRVVALPGETVMISKGLLYISGIAALGDCVV